jgi:electron transfer flavoprotein alpha subunit
MTTLVVLDCLNEDALVALPRLVTAAALLGQPVSVLAFGPAYGNVADRAAALAGVSEVLTADDPALQFAAPEAVTALLMTLKDQFDAFVAGVSSEAKAYLPRLAAKLDVMQLSEVIGIVDRTTFRRPIYAGNAVATVTTSDPILVLSVRPMAFTAAQQADAAAPRRTIAMPPLSGRVGTVLAREALKSDRPSLGTARVVVSGGRALGSEDAFNSVLSPLAEQLDAALGASRAAVDAGYAPNDWQVGQTGKVVAPELYIAVGISGAIQHLAGMKDSGVIVSINTDADAPLLQHVDYYLTGDLFEIVPQLTAALRT